MLFFFWKWKRAREGGQSKLDLPTRLHLRIAIWPLFVFATYILCALNSFYRKFETRVCFATLSFFCGNSNTGPRVRYAPPPPSSHPFVFKNSRWEKGGGGGRALTLALPFVLRCAQIIYTYVVDAGTSPSSSSSPRFGAKKYARLEKKYCCHSKEKCYVTGGPKKDKIKKKTSVFLLPTRRSSKSFPDRE